MVLDYHCRFNREFVTISEVKHKMAIVNLETGAGMPSVIFVSLNAHGYSTHCTTFIPTIMILIELPPTYVRPDARS